MTWTLPVRHEPFSSETFRAAITNLPETYISLRSGCRAIILEARKRKLLEVGRLRGRIDDPTLPCEFEVSAPTDTAPHSLILTFPNICYYAKIHPTQAGSSQFTVNGEDHFGDEKSEKDLLENTRELYRQIFIKENFTLY